MAEVNDTDDVTEVPRKEILLHLECIIYVLQNFTPSELVSYKFYLINSDFNQAFKMVFYDIKRNCNLLTQSIANTNIVADRVERFPLWVKNFDVVHMQGQFHTIFQGKLVPMHRDALHSNGITISSLPASNYWSGYRNVTFALDDSIKSKPIVNTFMLSFYELEIVGKKYAFFCKDLVGASGYRYISIDEFMRLVNGRKTYARMLTKLKELNLIQGDGFLVDPASMWALDYNF